MGFHMVSVILLIGSMLWIDVPFVRQSEQGCGAASIAMVMQYWSAKGYPVETVVMDEQRIMKLLYSKSLNGIASNDLQKYFEENGFTVFAFSGTFGELMKHLEKGRPLIAALEAKRRGAQLHYLVIAGIDREQELLLVNDPAERKLIKIERADFEKRWNTTGNWTLLAVPKK